MFSSLLIVATLNGTPATTDYEDVRDGFLAYAAEVERAEWLKVSGRITYENRSFQTEAYMTPEMIRLDVAEANEPIFRMVASKERVQEFIPLLELPTGRAITNVVVEYDNYGNPWTGDCTMVEPATACNFGSFLTPWNGDEDSSFARRVVHVREAQRSFEAQVEGRSCIVFERVQQTAESVPLVVTHRIYIDRETYEPRRWDASQQRGDSSPLVNSSLLHIEILETKPSETVWEIEIPLTCDAEKSKANDAGRDGPSPGPVDADVLLERSVP